MKEKIYFSRDEMYEMNRDLLLERGVKIEDIAAIAFRQQSKYNPNISMKMCIESVEKILSYRDIFHIVQLSIEIDRLCEEGKLRSPMQEIIRADLGMFGIDEIFGLNIASLYGVIGQTNFGDIDVNKPGIVKELNDHGKGKDERCHTFLDDVVGALAAAASTRVAQITSEETAKKDPHYEPIKFDL
ncbi:MAG TPA: phosphatidylglycerophosphatase A [Bacilli bacterium]|jgi:phosphatidylglycerophosphatase A|nr:phosphatidylglycerophosphatase A [Acholeplasmataceae bacterium]HNZ77148.1 phosphatidylglycerophosphatase A [Bacilli bacterium]HOD60835.1 phosphatidylglycerophosphatase A [Bacilli bacterium]HOE06583.1 phosphatidylglycerophosphatase A [Bacilli bacterium]HOH62263.1 phosphatidylglycerophosphatase A [Bacilli bacterium]